ncbi:DUF4064 domain-containing protein [Fredinandcohnia humi]
MKRTGELLLGSIGIVLYGFLSVLGISIVGIEEESSFFQEMKKYLMKDPEVKISDVGEIFGIIEMAGWIFTTVGILSIVFGIIAIVLVRRNKNPKAAGILFIAVGVISSIGTFGIAIINGLFFFIAGIMCLTRKQRLF